MNTPRLQPARITAVVLALVVLAWQVGNATAGRFVHPFLVADLVVSAWLLAGSAWPGRRGAALLLVSGFGAMLGVFLSAVTGRMIAGHFDPGTVAAAFGIVPCVLGIAQAGRAR
jgi:hypothetical protein